MSTLPSFAEMRDTLAEVLRSGRAGLVLGAGASASSGAPMWAELQERMVAAFPHTPTEDGMHPFEVAELIVETPAYSRAQLVEMVKDQFDTLMPDAAYQQLPRIDWQAVLTTNYDELVELAYRSPARTQTLQVTHLAEDALQLPLRPKHLLFCYLMGSVTQRHDSPASPVLTWRDFEVTRDVRAKMLAVVEGILMQGGKLIYAGYSFNDFIFLRVLEAVLERLGPQVAPYGFALMGPNPALAGAHLHRLRSRKVIPIAGTFEDLASLIQDIADDRVAPTTPPDATVASPAQGRRLEVLGSTVRLEDGVASVFDELFVVLSEEELAEDTEDTGPGARRRFLEGADLGWRPYAEGWAFKRHAYPEIFGHIRSLATAQDPDRNEVVLVHGPAGLGKSVLARQLAHDLYRKVGLPVLMARRAWVSRPDVRLVDRFARELQTGGLDPQTRPPVVLIIDQAELLEYGLPYRAVRYLKGQGRPAIIVLLARANEYFRGGQADRDLGEPTEFGLSERLEEDEITRLISHVQSLGVWEKERVTAEGFWSQYVESEFSSSFFDTIYTLVEPTREPLRDRVWSEYENLSDLAKRAYLLIAAVHQFGLALKMEVLRRALRVDFEEFVEDIVKSDARDVLFSDHVGGNLNVHFTGRSRMISQIVFERVAETHQAQLEVFQRVIQATDPSEMFGMDELDMVRGLLVQVLGPNGYDRRFSPEETAMLFREAVQRIEDDVLEHHCGLAEREAGNLFAAKDHLERSVALAATLPLDYSVQRESPQHIENSLAVVCGELALEALRRGALEESDELYEEARRHFVEARTGSFPNAAAFDAHARMLRDRATVRYKEGSTDRALALGEALEVADDGIDHVNSEYRPGLVELRADILARLGDLREAIQDLADRAEDGNPKERAQYHVILGRMVVDVANPKGKHWNRGLKHAARACELDPKLFAAWKLRARCYMHLQPEDQSTALEYLQQAVKLPQGREDVWCLFNAGVVGFNHEMYQEAFDLFRSLRRVARGHELQFSTVEFAGERGGADPFEYRGRVVRAGPDRLGIETEELDVFSPVRFNPRGQRYYTPRQGDTVTFAIGLNYRGITAMELERV